MRTLEEVLTRKIVECGASGDRELIGVLALEAYEELNGHFPSGSDHPSKACEECERAARACWPKFAVGELVLTPLGERLRVVACDLWGCTVDNGTPGGARYAVEVLERVTVEGGGM